MSVFSGLQARMNLLQGTTAPLQNETDVGVERNGAVGSPFPGL